jgi:hypothetical protein
VGHGALVIGQVELVADGLDEPVAGLLAPDMALVPVGEPGISPELVAVVQGAPVGTMTAPWLDMVVLQVVGL